ncbi:MAG TPA: hypothetical protein VF777_08255 [Phycisphaerales bacterium]
MSESFDPTQSAYTHEQGEDTPLLARELTGDLLCARCRYNLRGLSVRGRCPECGMSVRGTILVKVDPAASELQPIPFAPLVGLGLLIWPLGALIAAASIWYIRWAEMFAQPTPVWMVPALLGGVLASAAGALVIIRPHAHIPLDGVLRAAVGVFLYLPLALGLHVLYTRLDTLAPTPYMPSGQANIERSLLRLALSLILAVILACLRPNARLFVQRSMLLRSGRVDRQTMLAMVGALGIISLGDLAQLLAAALGTGAAQSALLVGTILIAVGSMFFTVGIVGVLVDCVRIVPSVLSRPISLESITGATRAEASALFESSAPPGR